MCFASTAPRSDETALLTKRRSRAGRAALLFARRAPSTTHPNTMGKGGICGSKDTKVEETGVRPRPTRRRP